MANAILLGVLSGCLTSAVILIIGITSKKIIIPWYQQLTYRGVDISGEWHCIDGSMTQENLINLTQHAGLVKGTATMTLRDDEPEIRPREYEHIRTFTVTGTVQDRFVTLTLKHVNHQRIGTCIYLLEVCGDGRKMEGMMALYSVQSSTIQSSYQVFFRDRLVAEKIAQPEIERWKAKKQEVLQAQSSSITPKKTSRPKAMS